MTKDDETCLKLGREVVRMIHDVKKIAKDESGYADRSITYPGGKIYLFVVNNQELANNINKYLTKVMDVEVVTPPSIIV